MITVYGFIAILLYVSALPTMVQCVKEMIDPNESDWNRRAAFLWSLVIPVVCVFWLPVLVCVVAILTYEKLRA